MKDSTNSDIDTRKSDHIRLCLDDLSQGTAPLFESVQIPYLALPELNLSDVQTTFKIKDKVLSQPLIISSMTGGTKHGKTINANLATAAEQTQVALGIGSQRIAIEKPEVIETFRVIRQNAPTAFVFANMGAIQLNYGYSIDHYRRVIDMIEADAIYLHINPLQEAIQPGGDTNYQGLLLKISKLISAIDTPVFVKEVGHGIDAATAQALIDMGVYGIDVAGTGGTSYSWVESKRANNEDFAKWFKNIGVSTEDAIRSIAPLKKNCLLVASGGIRSPIEGYKSHILGANLYASTRPFLAKSMLSAEAVITEINSWQKALQICQFVGGQKHWDNPKKAPLQP